MADNDRQFSWRQGNVVTLEAAKALNLMAPECDDQYFAVVASHDLDHFSDERSKKIWNSRHSGKLAKRKSGKGYYQLNLTINSKIVFAYLHRVIWILHFGQIPKGIQVDHINGVKSDNRIENLMKYLQASNVKCALFFWRADR